MDPTYRSWTMTLFLVTTLSLWSAEPAEAVVLTRFVTSPPITVAPGTISAAAVLCGEGEVLVGGGFTTLLSIPDSLVPIESFPESLNPGENRWTVAMRNPGQTARTFTIRAICAVGFRTQ